MQMILINQILSLPTDTHVCKPSILMKLNHMRLVTATKIMEWIRGSTHTVAPSHKRNKIDSEDDDARRRALD